MNDRLDYFGSVVNIAARLERLSSGTEVIISDAIRHDPEVAELLSKPDSQLALQPFEAQLKGFDEEQFHLWRVAHAPQLTSGPAALHSREA
jgi:class 3 adenylate cyclase